MELKYSRYAWAMNVVAPTQIRELRIPDQMSFSGHGAIAPDKSLLLSAFDFTASTASLLRYENSELIETIPVPSAGCHEFLFCPENPNTLILTNEFDANVKGLYRRNKNSLVWYDYKKRVIIKEVPSFLSQGPSHLTILRPGSNRILARGRHRVPALEVYENERVHLIECPTPHVQTNGEVEMLNAVLDPHDQEIAWATAPDYGLLMGVDLKSKKVIQTIYRDGILHVFAHRGELMVSVVNLSLGLSHITTLKNGQLQNSLGPFGDSSHMLFVSQS